MTNSRHHQNKCFQGPDAKKIEIHKQKGQDNQLTLLGLHK